MKHAIELLKEAIRKQKNKGIATPELAELESELQQLEGRGWISCSDDLMPDHNGHVLVVNANAENPTVVIGIQQDDNGFYIPEIGAYSDKVTHWQPLPSAPELTPNK